MPSHKLVFTILFALFVSDSANSQPPQQFQFQRIPNSNGLRVVPQYKPIIAAYHPRNSQRQQQFFSRNADHLLDELDTPTPAPQPKTPQFVKVQPNRARTSQMAPQSAVILPQKMPLPQAPPLMIYTTPPPSPTTTITTTTTTTPTPPPVYEYEESSAEEETSLAMPLPQPIPPHPSPRPTSPPAPRVAFPQRGLRFTTTPSTTTTIRTTTTTTTTTTPPPTPPPAPVTPAANNFRPRPVSVKRPHTSHRSPPSDKPNPWAAAMASTTTTPVPPRTQMPHPSEVDNNNNNNDSKSVSSDINNSVRKNNRNFGSNSEEDEDYDYRPRRPKGRRNRGRKRVRSTTTTAAPLEYDEGYDDYDYDEEYDYEDDRRRSTSTTTTTHRPHRGRGRSRGRGRGAGGRSRGGAQGARRRFRNRDREREIQDEDYEDEPRGDRDRSREREFMRERERDREPPKPTEPSTTTTTTTLSPNYKPRPDGRIIDYNADPNFPYELKGADLTDYPFFISIPESNFNCKGRHDGYYANIELKCQVYHHCAVGHQRYDFLCPNYTLFDQTTFTCRFVNTVDCEDSTRHYDRNNDLYIESTTADPLAFLKNFIVPVGPPLAESKKDSSASNTALLQVLSVLAKPNSDVKKSDLVLKGVRNVDSTQTADTSEEPLDRPQTPPLKRVRGKFGKSKNSDSA